MMAQRIGIRNPVITLLVILVLVLPGSAGLSAQVSAPSPSHGQVIAQGVQNLDGGAMQWHLAELEVPAAGEAPLVVSGAFVVVHDGQVLTTNAADEQQLLSSGQAMFAGSRTEILSASEERCDILVVDLVVDTGATDDIRTQGFQVDPARHNLQLTTGLLTPGEVDAFQPANEYPYLFATEAGAVNILSPGSDKVETFLEWQVGDWSGEIELTSKEDARYMIFSIGAEVPAPTQPVTAPTETGNLKLVFYECSETVLTSPDLSDCALIEYPVQAEIMRGSTTIFTGVDGLEQADHSWLFQDLVAGDWNFRWIIGDGTPAPQIILTGDAELRGDQWLVEVRPGENTVANVLIVPLDSALDRDQGIDMSSLTVYFLECPSGWVEGMDLGDCGLAQGNPNLELRDTRGAGIVLNTDWDAVSSEAGVYTFSNIPAETYFLSLSYDGIWTYENTYFQGSAYTDGLDWYIDVPADSAGAEIYIVLGHIGDGTVVNSPEEPAIPSPGSFGYAMIVQTECSPTQNDANCTPAQVPWEVYLTNLGTYEVYTLSAEGTPMGDGTWMLIIPAGVYGVEVETGGWYMEYSATIEVFADTESYLYLEGYAP